MSLKFNPTCLKCGFPVFTVIMADRNRQEPISARLMHYSAAETLGNVLLIYQGSQLNFTRRSFRFVLKSAGLSRYPTNAALARW